MAKRSAGLLIHRQHEGRVELLLVHPGGPYWAKKDAGSWSIPKGLVDEGEDELSAARREVQEEIGHTPEGPNTFVGSYKQPSGGKIVIAWSVPAEIDIDRIVSNSFAMEWPPRSGLMNEFPEVDRAGWFSLDEADVKLVPGQRPILQDFAREIAAAHPAA